MTLGRLIQKLERCPQEWEVYFDFGWFVPAKLHSWRGDYSQLAIGYNECGGEVKAPTVGTLVAMLRDAIGKPYAGYKGGDFVMHEGTTIWVENYGDGNHTGIRDIRELNWKRVIIETEYQEY